MHLEIVPSTSAGGLVQLIGFDPSALGLTGFVSLIIVSIIRGWLVPRGTVTSIVDAKDAENERLRQTIVTLEARGDMQDEAVRQLITTTATTQHLTQEIHLFLMRQTGTPIPPGYPPTPLTIDPAGGT